MIFEAPIALGAAHQFLTFRLGDLLFGIPFLRVGEVRTLQTTMPVMNPPNYASGIVVLHGSTTPVLDLRLKFDRPATFSLQTRLIFVWLRRPDRADRQIGLLVDRVDDVVTLEPREIDPPRTGGREARAEFILGTIARGTQLRLLLDVDRLSED